MQRGVTPLNGVTQAIDIENIAAMRLDAQPLQAINIHCVPSDRADHMPALHQPWQRIPPQYPGRPDNKHTHRKPPSFSAKPIPTP